MNATIEAKDVDGKTIETDVDVDFYTIEFIWGKDRFGKDDGWFVKNDKGYVSHKMNDKIDAIEFFNNIIRLLW